jgi:hypothetical protein
MDKYLFTLPIGDWSDDGHGQCDYYHVESNKPIEDIREAHFKIKEATGIDIHSIANEYEENMVYEDNPIIAYLKSKGVEPGELFENDGNDYYADSDGMARLWMMLLQDADPTLKLEMVPEQKIPMLAFYGFDEKKRHIDFVGYGTF